MCDKKGLLATTMLPPGTMHALSSTPSFLKNS